MLVPRKADSQFSEVTNPVIAVVRAQLQYRYVSVRFSWRLGNCFPSRPLSELSRISAFLHRSIVEVRTDCACSRRTGHITYLGYLCLFHQFVFSVTIVSLCSSNPLHLSFNYVLKARDKPIPQPFNLKENQSRNVTTPWGGLGLCFRVYSFLYIFYI